MGKLHRYIANIPGWRTNRKIIVIESDDWGSIRTLLNVFENFLFRTTKWSNKQ